MDEAVDRERVWYSADDAASLLRRVVVGDVAIVATFQLPLGTGQAGGRSTRDVLTDVAAATRLVRDAAAQVGRLAPVIAAIVAPAGASAPNFAELRRAVRRQDWHFGDFHPVVFDPTNEDARLTWEKLARAGLGALGLGVLRRPRGDAAYMERLRASMREDDPDAVRALYAAVLAFLGGDVHALDEWASIEIKKAGGET